MKSDIRDQWVTALESGEYAQGEGVLHEETREGTHRYCCLGVLCDLAVKAGVIPAPVRVDRTASQWGPDDGGRPAHYVYGETADVTDVYSFDYDEPGSRSYTVLPVPVQKWAELDSTSPLVKVGVEAGYDGEPDHDRFEGLTALNDHGQKFPTIARLIREGM